MTPFRTPYILRWITNWIPFTSPRPFTTFGPRLLRKLRFIGSNSFIRLGNLLFLTGAREIGFSSVHNALLQLNKNSPLGAKGEVIEVPKDNMIYKHIKFKGQWEFAESRFLAEGISAARENDLEDVAILDIGANSGLVTLQALNIAGTIRAAYLFEPLENHCAAIKHNLSKFMSITKVSIHEFALGEANGNADIYTQKTNLGNTSLFNSLSPGEETLTRTIRVVDTSDYFNRSKLHQGYIIKSDTQGMDALILARIPTEIWDLTERLIVEVWAIPEIRESDVDLLLTHFSKFDFIDWSPNSSNRLTQDEIKDFWTGKSGKSKNLYLRKLIGKVNENSFRPNP